MWIEEGKRWKKEEQGIMEKERRFPLFEILWLRMYSLESSEYPCVSVYVSPLLPTPSIS